MIKRRPLVEVAGTLPRYSAHFPASLMVMCPIRQYASPPKYPPGSPGWGSPRRPVVATLGRRLRRVRAQAGASCEAPQT